MSLSDFVDEAEGQQLALTVYNADSAVVTGLRERFADRAVVVERATTADGEPESSATLRDGAEVVASVDVDVLEETLRDPSATGLDSDADRPVLDRLSDTVFTSWDRARMVSASREIEDRAWRVGRGRLDAGFQHPDILRGESETYERLARTDIDVHAYVHGEGAGPSVPGVDVTVVEDEEIDRCWFVIYDGAGDDGQACALVAVEDAPGTYRGFWTYDAGTVGDLFSYLDEAYPRAEH